MALTGGTIYILPRESRNYIHFSIGIPKASRADGKQHRVFVEPSTFNGPAQTGIEFSEPFWNYEKNPRKRPYVNGNNTLSKQSPSTKGSLTYDADTAPVAQLGADPEELKFSIKFDRRTSLMGPSRAVLYLSTSTKRNFDVCVQLRKADGSGRLLQNLNIPFEDLNVSSVDDVPLISPTKYLGPSGILQA